MDKRLRRAYDQLVPADQIIIDAMIAALHKKDVDLRNVTDGVYELADQKALLEKEVESLRKGVTDGD